MQSWDAFIATTDTILMTVANLGYLDLLLNMYHTLQRCASPSTLAKFVVFTYDKKLQAALQPYGCIKTFFLKYDKVSSKAVAFKEEDWNAVTRFKLLAIDFVIKANRAVLYCDPDIAFVRDPLLSVSSLRDDKLYVQAGSPWCSGVIYAHYKSDLAHLVFGGQHWKQYTLDDEAYIRWRVENLKRAEDVAVLPFADYPNGLAWSRYGNDDQEVQAWITGKSCVLFHYNHISGIEAKIARMIKTGAYIATMKVVQVPSKFQLQLDDVCKEIRGTSYPPHHAGYHLEECCEWLVKETLKTRLLCSEYTYLPMHWTALAVSGKPNILEDLKQFCKSLFKSTPRTKYWTVVQHCKGLYKSCGVQVPAATRLFMTSDPNHALDSASKAPTVGGGGGPVTAQKTIYPIAKKTAPEHAVRRKTPVKKKKQPPQRLLAIPIKPYFARPKAVHPVIAAHRPPVIAAHRPAHPVGPAPRPAPALTQRIETEWTTVALVSSSRNPNQFSNGSPRDLLASFIGNIGIHPLRQKLKEAMAAHDDVVFKQGEYRKAEDVMEFEKLMRRSKFALCPRGFGTTSFRLSEAMEFGCIPVYVSDVFSLPFANLIDAKDYCVLVKESEIATLHERLLAIPQEEVDRLRARIKEIYECCFTMEGCCKTILFDYIVKGNDVTVPTDQVFGVKTIKK